MRGEAFIGRWALIPVLLLGASACALFDRTSEVDIRAVQPTAGAAVSPDEAYYNAAVRAISGRNYALALDYLQAARKKQVEDVRVLNAFGVIYDKLGRFDLSARYYSEARKLDPESSIIAANLAYSAVLQGLPDRSPAPSEVATVAASRDTAQSGSGAQQIELEVTASAPATVDRTDSLAYAVEQEPGAQTRLTSPRVTVSTRTAPSGETAKAGILTAVIPAAAVAEPTQSGKNRQIPTKPAPGPARKSLLTGAPLVIVNASGQSGVAEPVRLGLASQGWTAPRWAMIDSGQAAATTIRFMPSNAIVAHALARTLPFSAQLVSCKSQCGGLRLVLGRDVLRARIVKSASGQMKRG